MNNNRKMSGTVRGWKSRSGLLLVATPIIALSVSATVMAQEALGGSDLILPTTAASTADMVNLKTANAGRSGGFSILVTNTGSVEVTGATVTDDPGLGAACNKGNPVMVTGSGVPEGSFTVATLSGSGIVLGTLQPGQSASITYSCQAK